MSQELLLVSNVFIKLYTLSMETLRENTAYAKQAKIYNKPSVQCLCVIRCNQVNSTSYTSQCIDSIRYLSVNTLKDTCSKEAEPC